MIDLQLDEVRRLTGPNLLWDKPGAIIDVLFNDIKHQRVLNCLQKWTKRLLTEFDWQAESYIYRVHAYGINFAISAPLDSLYSACDLLELAWHCCVSELQNSAPIHWQKQLLDIKTALKDEQNPALLAFIAMAEQGQVCCLVDDDEVSLGMGATTHTWPVRELPALQSINWQRFTPIPCALITGTNGKSTSVRLAAQIAKAAGISAGVTSTDFIRVGDDIIDHGDYSGPGGARMLLRDKRCQMAFLEVARGGILRRGLPVTKVNAALITNIASDHLGQYGINTVAELAQTKFVVVKALQRDGVLVLNADDPLIVECASSIMLPICWFSQDEFHPLIQAQIQQAQRAVFVRNNHIIYHYKGQFEDLGDISTMPMTFAGAALHNVQNALGVVGLSKALNLTNSAIIQGLSEFGRDSQDNPGRGNIYHLKGCQVIVDFAHNEHGMQAMINLALQLNGNDYIAMFSHAGDRSDEDIAKLTQAVSQLNAKLYIAAETQKYLRGRLPHEVTNLSKKYLVDCGVEPSLIHISDSPLQGAKLALQMANAGDVILLFVHDEREQVHQFLMHESEVE